jgi:hypothetical protein
MSEAKTPKKDTTKAKKAKKKEPKTTTESGTATEVGSVDKSKDKAADKAVAPPKSASQSSISHFSSVATEEYRSGWADIFGGKKAKK